jgi:hypothetical protein
MSRSHSNGLSTIDVIVCAALLGVFFLIVFPNLARLRAEDKRMDCARNLNQLAKAMFMYADVPANGIFPSHGTEKDSYDDKTPMKSLNLLYNRYIIDPRVFACPSAPPGKVEKVPGLSEDKVTKLKGAIKDLDADAFETRENAVKAIRELGPGSIPILNETLKSGQNAEVKARIGKLVFDFTDGILTSQYEKLAKIDGADLPKGSVFLSADTCSYGYDPGHSPNNAVVALMADRKGAKQNSDNHGLDAGQNVLIGAGTIEFRETVVHKLGDTEDPDIYAKNANEKLTRDVDAFIRQ